MSPLAQFSLSPDISAICCASGMWCTRLLEAVPELWEAVDGQLQAFEDWLRQLASSAG